MDKMIAIQVVGEGGFALQPFNKRAASLESIHWKSYQSACSCVYQEKIRIIGKNELERCQGSCVAKTAFWTIIPYHAMGAEDLVNNLQILFGTQFTMTETKSFKDEYGELIEWGDWKKIQGKLIRKLYRSKYLFPRLSQMDSGMVPKLLSKRWNISLVEIIRAPYPLMQIGWTEISPKYYLTCFLLLLTLLLTILNIQA